MKLIKLLMCCLLIVMLASCRKAEFMPEEEGQPVPHTDITITLKEVLTASPYTLFKAAWQRSNMDKIIKAKGNKVPLILLVPSDAAFIADGLTLEVINKTTPELLDSVLLYHAIAGNMKVEDFKVSENRFTGRTMLENPNLRVKPAVSGESPFDIYIYLHYLKYADGGLFINGKKESTTAPVQAKDGVLWPVDHVLHKPAKTILQVLEEDGRFGMFLELNLRNDALITEFSEGAVFHDFTQGITLAPFANYNVVFNSIFAIPDEVFHQAGFNTVDDVLALNDRNPTPYFDYDTYTLIGGLATDTLVAYNRWGATFSYNDPQSGRGEQGLTNFYTNDLTNNLLSNYTIVSSGAYGKLPVYTNPLEFSKEGGTVKVKVKGANYPAAAITDPDINTIMGPVHVVDHFMVPKGFKLK
ncbi:putative surface protein with fasciclin (FAS1) repeats [Pedobacter cryoconitis]|uniref:Putative surface protein with fasciclin (FAS1) repeats n=1 Tax=Pedobacter cryoconitis TaxID=188932 RepID=A0A7W8ZLS1_9SPHI|nr:fasciclin domain-containing protein [Pedobacter cryoconitis]MBB5636133.1 putative surface protein with fasciclin (FAS1) repeats [Pedobacter cryoconitis]